VAQVARGEIWLFGFPKPDKKRPVLVLTRQDMIGRLNTVTVAPITSTIREVPSEVLVGVESGLKQPSAINLHHLMTVPREGLRAYVGAVPPRILESVREALLFSLGYGSIGAGP
jgi:mRNA interferase MazF